MDCDRQRTPNFSETEINCLIDLVKGKKHILECKKTDKVFADQKNQCWKDVASDFNSQNESLQFRSHKVLKKKYENLKRDLKKRSADKKKSLYGTGGGPPVKVETKNFDENLQSILHEKQIVGMESSYDNDYVKKHHEETDEVEEEWLLEDPVDNPQIAETEMDVTPVPMDILQVGSGYSVESRNKYTPTSSQTANKKKLHELKVPDPKSSWSRLATIKANWSEEKHKTEIKLLEEEHRQRLLFMQKEDHMKQEKHELEMEILRYEFEEKKKELPINIFVSIVQNKIHF